MRYPASEKAEIIELVEQSHLPAKRTLDKLGIPRATFYRWYDRYREGGIEALADHRSRPDRVWNRIPNNVRGQIIDLALELPELSSRSASAPRSRIWLRLGLCFQQWNSKEPAEFAGFQFNLAGDRSWPLKD